MLQLARSLLVLALSMAPVACGGEGEPAAPGAADSSAELESAAADRAVDSFQALRLQFGQMAEIDVHVQAGDQLVTTFTSSDPVLWDIHEHVGPRGETTKILKSGNSASEQLLFTAPKAGLYSFLWASSTPTKPTIEVNVRVTGQADETLWFLP